MNRIDRLHAILTHLQSKKRVTAQEIADRFDISLRTVYRDVKALDESGVPVIGEAGSGYSIMEGYRLPPVMFTQEEAAALLVGSKLAERLTDQSVKKHFNSALFKIKAVLRATDKDHVDSLDNHIAVLKRELPHNETSDQYLAALQKAIVGKQVIFMRYRSTNEAVSERTIEPIGLCHYGHGWHLIGWCRMRNDYRDFRVSRIQHLQVKDESFAHKTHRTLQEHIQTMIHRSELYEIVVRFNRETARYLQDMKHYYGFVRQEEENDFVRMYFVAECLKSFGHWMLTFTDTVHIESPAELQTIMKDLAGRIAGHYRL